VFIRRILLRVLPLPKKLHDYANLVRSVKSLSAALQSYAAWYDFNRRAVIEWHKSELVRIDWEYAFHDAQRRLIIARERARERGVKPLAPEYPDLQDFLKR
jgi:hypothetical protein